jgi:hypothetical protein
MIAVFDEALETTIVSAPKKSSSARKSSMRNEVKKSGKNRMCSASRSAEYAVALGGRRQRGPVRRGVDEALVVDAVGDDQQVAGAGEVAVDAPPLREVGVPRVLDVGVAPHVQLSPVRVRCREEAPVVHRLPEHGVGDVVRSQPKGFDPEKRLPVLRRRWVAMEEAAFL